MTNPDDIALKLYALEADGPRELPVAPGIHELHELFDELPLGIYEAMRTFRHDRFLGLEEHLERARASIAAAGLEELDEEALRAALHRIVSHYPAEESRLRFDVLRASASQLGTQSRVLVAIGPFHAPSEAVMRAGVRVGITDAMQRREPLVKSAGWVLERRPLEQDARDYDVLLADDSGRLLECTSANFFALRNGVLYTASEHILLGVTRRLVLELAAELRIPTRLVAVMREEIATLDEAFLTSSSRGIVPIVEVGDQTVGAGQPGPITQRLVAGYDQMANARARWAVRTL